MSKIGKKPIEIPSGVTVKIENGNIAVKGPKGELKNTFVAKKFKVETIQEEGKNFVKIDLIEDNTEDFAMWGLTRALINNMITGVTQGFEKRLEVRGIGYKAALQGKTLVLNVGFTHPVEVAAPAGIEFAIEKNIIVVKGIDKQLVGQTAATIRDQKKPEPYQGKGIRYFGEKVRQKVGKKSVASAK